ncbi:FG-GAP repeat domain-containing protein [Ideonella sp.]|uniref:FG-GAP repeat domain-containing protein n=1 Tax=Ideonella sp. TaxID=1929293 RepID=UPI0037BF34D8
MEVYLQQTGGGYAAPVRLEFSQGTWLYHMVSIDLQGDRRTEWAVSQEFGSRPELVIYRLNAGQLQVHQRLASVQADLLAVGDLNQDGRPDVVAASPNTGRMEVFSNDGAGRLLAGAHSYFGAVETSSLVLVDVDGDQRLDVLTGPLLNLGRAAPVLSAATRWRGLPPLSSVRDSRSAANHTR